MIQHGYTILPATRKSDRMTRRKLSLSTVNISKDGKVVKRIYYPVNLPSFRRAWHRAIDFANSTA